MKPAVLVATAALLVGGGAAVAAVNSPSSAPAECGKGVSARGFHVFTCMSGGAAAGHPHPKELLVLRSDGSSAAYPAFRLGGLAAGDGEVVAAYDLSLVRVMSSRLVTLVTAGELVRALRVRPAAIMDLYDLRVDARGDVYFVASVLRGRHSGCRAPLLERTGGTIRQIRASTTTNDVCS